MPTTYAKVTGGDVTLTVLKLLDRGFYAKEIASDIKKSEVTVHRHIQKLRKNGLIEDETHSTIKTYTVTQKGKTAIKANELRLTPYRPTMLKSGTHFRIYIPILKQGRLQKWDTVNDKFRNSIIKHKDLSAYIDGVSAREIEGKGIELNIKHRTIPTFKVLLPIAVNSINWAMGFFSAHGYDLDIVNWYVNDTHNTVWTKEIQDVAERSGRYTVAFPWNRAKFTPRDPAQTAKTWFDNTPEPNLETNDADYAQAFIQMPVTVTQILNLMEIQNRNMAKYAEHMERHTGALVELKKMAMVLRRSLSQKSLREFT